MRYRIGLPSWFSGKESACNAEDLGSISGLERPPRGGNGNLLQYSCLENPMDRGAWRAIVHEVAESDTTEVTEQMRYRLEQGGFCSSKTHSVNTYLWVDLGPGGRSDALVLAWWPSDPSPSPLSSQHPSPSALFPGSDTWGCKNFSGSYVSQLCLGQPEGAPAGDRREEVRSQGISSLPSVLGVFPEATSFPPWLQLPADQPIRGSFFQPPFLFSAYMYQWTSALTDLYLPYHLLFDFKDLPTLGWPISYIKFSLLKHLSFYFPL